MLQAADQGVTTHCKTLHWHTIAHWREKRITNKHCGLIKQWHIAVIPGSPSMSSPYGTMLFSGTPFISSSSAAAAVVAMSLTGSASSGMPSSSSSGMPSTSSIAVPSRSSVFTSDGWTHRHTQTNKLTDKRTDRRTDRETHGQINRLKDRQTNITSNTPNSVRSSRISTKYQTLHYLTVISATPITGTATMAHRRSQQSGFTPGRSTCDRIATLNNIAQRRQDYGHPTYVAYVDLRAAFDTLSRSSLIYCWPGQGFQTR